MKGTVRTSNRIMVLAYGTCVQVLKDGYIVWTGCVLLGPKGRHRDARRERVSAQARDAIVAAIEDDAISPLDVRWRSAAHDPARHFLEMGEGYFSEERATDDNPDDLLHYATDRDERLDIIFD